MGWWGGRLGGQVGGVLVGGGGRWLGWLLEARSQELGRSLAHDKVPARSSLTYPRYALTYLVSPGIHAILRHGLRRPC